MLQYFNHRPFHSSFEKNTFPRLAYSCKTEPHHIDMPRAMHMHEDIVEIVFITSGRGVHIIGEQTYNTQKGDLMIYDAQVLHDEIADGDSLNVYCLGIADLHYPDKNPNTLLPPHSKAVYPCNEQYESFLHIIELIHKTNLSQSASAGEALSYLLRVLIVMISDLIAGPAFPVQSAEAGICQQIKQYLDQHYAQDISLTFLSKELHLSPYYISHLFKKSEGISPMKYVIRRRIGEAQSLLINTKLSVTEIALQVGYRNSNHFHTAFVKAIGLTPKNYRNYWTAGIKKMR